MSDKTVINTFHDTKRHLPVYVRENLNDHTRMRVHWHECIVHTCNGRSSSASLLYPGSEFSLWEVGIRYYIGSLFCMTSLCRFDLNGRVDKDSAKEER